METINFECCRVRSWELCASVHCTVFVCYNVQQFSITFLDMTMQASHRLLMGSCLRSMTAGTITDQIVLTVTHLQSAQVLQSSAIVDSTHIFCWKLVDVS